LTPERDQAELLLRKAREDQSVLLKLAHDQDIADSVLGFHAQQAVEKALKAVLASRGEDYPWTHDLQLLLRRLDAAAAHVPSAVDDARRLSPWAVEFRYGETIDESLDREEAVRQAGAVLDWAASVVRGGPAEGAL
jgi:HEPN domain-containing protein